MTMPDHKDEIVYTIETKSFGTEPGAYRTKLGAQRAINELRELRAYRDLQFEINPRRVKP